MLRMNAKVIELVKIITLMNPRQTKRPLIKSTSILSSSFRAIGPSIRMVCKY